MQAKIFCKKISTRGDILGQFRNPFASFDTSILAALIERKEKRGFKTLHVNFKLARVCVILDRCKTKCSCP